MRFFVLSGVVICSALVFCGCSDDSSDEELNRAVSLAKAGNWQESAKIANETAGASSGAAPMLLQALAFEKSGELDKAIDLAQQCAEQHPNDFTVLYTLGRLYSLDPKRQDKALSTLEKAVKLRENVNALILLCNIGIKSNDPNVIKYLQQLIRRTDLQEKERGKAYYLLGIQQKKANRLSEYHSAMENARKISEKHNPELLFYIADFYEQDGGYNHETALLLYKKFISKSKDCDQSLINEAQNRIKRLSKHKK